MWEVKARPVWDGGEEAERYLEKEPSHIHSSWPEESRTVLSNGTFCGNGNVLHLCDLIWCV